MNERRQPEIWKVRTVKAYREAHNHLLIGEVVARDTVSVTLLCRSFHFGRSVNAPKDVVVGVVGLRIVPWTRIEIINVLPHDFDYRSAKVHMGPGGYLFFGDGKHSCPIATVQERRS